MTANQGLGRCVGRGAGRGAHQAGCHVPIHVRAELHRVSGWCATEHVRMQLRGASVWSGLSVTQRFVIRRSAVSAPVSDGKVNRVTDEDSTPSASCASWCAEGG